MAKPTELLQGTLDLLILRTLELRPLHGVGIADALVAATASTTGLTLWTLNRRHYPMDDLRFHDAPARRDVGRRRPSSPRRERLATFCWERDMPLTPSRQRFYISKRDEQ